MKKLQIIFSSLVFAGSLIISTFAQAENIKIGVSFRMLSDVGYKHGELITDTVKEWNSTGGINGNQVDLILYNDECKSEKGVANATKLAYEDKVHVIIGSSCSSVTMPMVPVITKAKVPQIIPHSTSSKITLQGSEWIFRVPVSSRFYKIVQAKFTVENAGKKIAHIYVPDQASMDFSKSMIEYVKNEYGVDPVYEVQAGEKETDFRSYLLKAKATNPDALVCSGLVDETVRCLVQSYEVGIPKSVARVANSVASKVEVPTNAGKAAVGVTYAAAFAASDSRPIAKKFVKHIKKTYGVTPGHDFSQMEDLLTMLKPALEKAQGKFSGNLANDREALRDSLAGITNFTGLASGPISFCKDGSPECRDGNRTPVMIGYTRGGKNWKTAVSGTTTFNASAGL
jgi:branched-chain amino acid transport system substrate-binding protein